MKVGFLDLWSGVGIVVASMIGAGVFLSAGFMAQELSGGWILTAWVVGAALAMAGARTYAEASVLFPRSGGEYRYLSELIHPAIGYLAGWASLLVGFAAPIAISAYSASAFAFTVFPGESPRIAGTILIILLAALHSGELDLSKWTQNSLVLLKALIVLAFVGLGLTQGNNHWPRWVPANGSTEVSASSFATSLFYVAYAFSGWNAAAYVSEEFRHPTRDVPRAMMLGCALVGVIYLLVNWVLVANLTPAQGAIVFTYEEARVTLGHLVARDFLGPLGSTITSLGIALILVSTTSAMMLIGPRVLAEMAEDGLLPSFLRGRLGTPPRVSVMLQGLLAIVLLHLHTVGDLLSNVAGILVFFSALVAVGILLLKRRQAAVRYPRKGALLAATIYVGASIWMLYNQFKAQTGLLPWLAVLALFGVGAYFVAARKRV